nr:amidohydrolase [Betaproteobacteria bacterium]
MADKEIAKAIALGTDYLKSYVRAPIPIMTKIAQAGVDEGIPTGTHMLSPGSAAGLGGTTHLSATQRMGYGWSKSTNGVTYQDAYDLHAQSDFHVVDTLFSSVGALVGQDPSLIADERFSVLVPPNFLTSLQTQAGTPPTLATLATVKRDVDQSGKVQSAGGLVALGTDSPLVVPGIALHTNLRAGGLSYSNLEALQNVTINAARMS